MATKVLVQTLCDLEHKGDDVEGFTVTVTTPDGTWDVDVCSEHASFLLELAAAGRRQGRARRRGAATGVQ